MPSRLRRCGPVSSTKRMRRPNDCRSMRGTNTVHSRSRARSMRGVVSSSLGNETYMAMRQPFLRWRWRSALRATSWAACARSAGETLRRRARRVLRKALRSCGAAGASVMRWHSVYSRHRQRSASPAKTTLFAGRGTQAGETNSAESGAADFQPGRTTGIKRHPHVPVRTVALEPEQQVGRAATGKAFRSKRTCTMLPATHCPWVVQTRVRGNPERVSNTAGDATSDSTRTLLRAQDLE